MIPKTVDLTMLVGSIKGLDSKTITKQIIEDRKDDEERGEANRRSAFEDDEYQA